MNKFFFFNFLLALSIALQGSASFAKTRAPKASFDYSRAFEITRQVLTRPQVVKFLKESFAEALEVDPEYKEIYKINKDRFGVSESWFMNLLQSYPDTWSLVEKYLEQIPADTADDTAKQKELRERFREQFKQIFEDRDIIKKFAETVDPFQPYELETSDGTPAIKSREVYFSHNHVVGGKTMPPDDLVAQWVKAIDETQKELLINTFEFDVPEITEALIRAHKRGVSVRLGVDKNRATAEDARASMVAEIKKLKSAGVEVVLVDPVGLNHQKLGVFDWNDSQRATVIESSGNLTNSCSSPRGDLNGLDAKPEDVRLALPNANHLLVIKSQILGFLVQHTLIKTFDLGLRGSDYPAAGAFKLRGPNFSLIQSFSPNGAQGDVNRDMFSQMIRQVDGPIHIMAFAFSSQDLEDTLFEVAERKVKEGKKFEFYAIGDKPFALQDWSALLSMSGLILNKETGLYEEDPKSRWFKLLGKEGLEELRRNILVGPRSYKDRSVTLNDGTQVKAGAKIHHKVTIVGEFSTAGSSFNQSANANTNQEQILIWHDAELAELMRGSWQGLRQESKTSVHKMALVKNRYKKQDPPKPKVETVRAAGICEKPMSQL